MQGTEPAPESIAPLRHGDLVGAKYRVNGVLGSGGMGYVYSARHEVLGQDVAVKVLRSDALGSPEAVARFVGEARAVARIKSEHVVRVIDAGRDEQLRAPFMVMERLHGLDLAAILVERGALPVALAADYVLQSLQALAEAHALGMVHRDLKPANLFVAEQKDGSHTVKILDFGISKSTDMLGLAPEAVATSTRQVLGTPAYMSPEQLKSSKHVDARSDIWSLGVLLFQLVNAELPFHASSVGELFAALFENETPQRRRSRRNVPAAFDEVITGCLKRTPANRFADVAELASALAPFASPHLVAVALPKIAQALGRALPSPGGAVSLARVRAPLDAETAVTLRQVARGGAVEAADAPLHESAATPTPSSASRALWVRICIGVAALLAVVTAMGVGVTLAGRRRSGPSETMVAAPTPSVTTTLATNDTPVASAAASSSPIDTTAVRPAAEPSSIPPIASSARRAGTGPARSAVPRPPPPASATASASPSLLQHSRE